MASLCHAVRSRNGSHETQTGVDHSVFQHGLQFRIVLRNRVALTRFSRPNSNWGARNGDSGPVTDKRGGGQPAVPGHRLGSSQKRSQLTQQYSSPIPKPCGFDQDQTAASGLNGGSAGKIELNCRARPALGRTRIGTACNRGATPVPFVLKLRTAPSGRAIPAWWGSRHRRDS
jgi:hypothetical protein